MGMLKAERATGQGASDALDGAKADLLWSGGWEVLCG
jgi:hypothetical protein